MRLCEIICTMPVTYIIGSLALIVKPGPDLTCTIATALSDGKANAAAARLARSVEYACHFNGGQALIRHAHCNM